MPKQDTKSHGNPTKTEIFQCEPKQSANQQADTLATRLKDVRVLEAEEESEMTTNHWHSLVQMVPMCKQKCTEKETSPSRIFLNAGQETYRKYLLFVLQKRST